MQSQLNVMLLGLMPLRFASAFFVGFSIFSLTQMPEVGKQTRSFEIKSIGRTGVLRNISGQMMNTFIRQKCIAQYATAFDRF